MKWLLFLFIVLPTAELALLLYSGKTMGVGLTLSIILFTGIVGAFFAKRQGIRAWGDLQRRMQLMETPGDAMIDSVCILLGGLLLIMPGFITDLVGFFLLFAWPRNLIRPFIHKWIFSKVQKGQIIIRS